MTKRQKPDTDNGAEGSFFISAGYGANTRQPFVGIEFTDKTIQVRPEDARRLAHNLLAAAEAAETDGMLMQFYLSMDFSLQEAAKMLVLMRRFRDGQAGDDNEAAPVLPSGQVVSA